MHSIPVENRASRLLRRRLLATLATAPMLSAVSLRTALAAPAGRARPPWPAAADWAGLSARVGGRLEPVVLPDLAPDIAARLLSNPVYIGGEPGLTQSSGWIDAWRSAPSRYVVKARDAADVAQAVRFGRTHNVRLVVKGGGHSYHGGSSAPDSLLIWTRAMNQIVLHERFTPLGVSRAPVPAVTVGAGCTWGAVYAAVTTGAGRYVQGGGCTTVGVAGMLQGGGFGNFSKAFGLAAASLLEAEIVTADGAVLTVNAARHPDLFWALKGGGGGSFGVVTRVTLATHPLPEIFGAVRYTVEAASDAAFRSLLDRFIGHYQARLFNPYWGEQVVATPRNRLIVEMVFQGLDEAAALDAWRDLAAFVDADPQSFRVLQPLKVFAVPARRFWDPDYLDGHLPGAATRDDRPGARPGDFYWTGDGEQAGAMWHGMESLWLPAALLAEPGRSRLVDGWFNASRRWRVAFHFNKGLAGGSASALAASRDTSMNPQVLDAFALAIIAGSGPSSFPGALPRPDLDKARADAASIGAAMLALRRAAPDAGCYLYECGYFLENWRRAAWGANGARLDAIKRRYDPDGVFLVHHGVGSETWPADRFARPPGA